MAKVMEQILHDIHGNYILPFFWQHGEDEATLRDYMKVISEAGIGAVCVESRPHPDFCGDKWWQDMDIILEEAQLRGMKVWILDDSHFPTGFANGAMKAAPLSRARRSVCCQKYELAKGETLSLSAAELQHPSERTLSAIEKMIGGPKEIKPQSDFTDDTLIGISVRTQEGRSDLSHCLLSDGSFSYTAGEDCAVYKMNATRNRGPHPDYINMTDRDSVRVLIDAVYEKHYERYAPLFGTVIEGFFSDEPELGNGHLYDHHHEMGRGFDMDYPWSEELDAALRARFGDSFSCRLPLIWETEGDEKERASARLIYMDVLTRLVEKNFSFQVGDWCRAHGVKYIGHIIEDNGQHCRTGTTLGHYFRALKGQDWAGIDDIGGQVYPMGEDDTYDGGVFRVRNGNFYHFLLGKLAASLAVLDPWKKGNSMCEIFGNYGWSEGLRLEKYLADHFMVRGINHFVPHAFSAKAFPDPDCPPHFYAHGHNPEFKAFGQLMTYMNRICGLISDGRHIAPVAVMYHGEAEWTGRFLADELVARKLAEGQIEFDIVPQDIFAEPGEYRVRISDRRLQVNTQQYDAVLIPCLQFVTETFAKGIQALTEAGVKVYFVGGKPEAVLGDRQLMERLTEVPEISLEDVCSLLTGKTGRDCTYANQEDLTDLAIAPKNPYIRYYHYVKDGVHLYMLVNEGETVYEGALEITGRYAPVKDSRIFAYDAWNHKLTETCLADGCGSIEIRPHENVILILADTKEAADQLASAATEKAAMPEALRELSPLHAWKRSIAESIEYPAFRNETTVSFPDDYSKVDGAFSGWFRYENSFTAPKNKRCFVEITDAFEIADLYVNDAFAGTQLYPPFRYEITDLVAEGENEVRIEVATTLERETYRIPDGFGRPKPEPTCGSGITGTVRILSE